MLSSSLLLLLLLFLGSAAATAASIPTSWDWRAVNGSSFVTPVQSQLVPKLCGAACAAHNHASYISDRIKIAAARGDPSVGTITGGDVILSAQVLINCAKPSSTKGCSVGGSSGALKYLSQHGIPDVSCAPYLGFKQECTPVNTCYRFSPANKTAPAAPIGDVPLWGVSDYGALPANDIAAIQNEVMARGLGSSIDCRPIRSLYFQAWDPWINQMARIRGP